MDTACHQRHEGRIKRNKLHKVNITAGTSAGISAQSRQTTHDRAVYTDVTGHVTFQSNSMVAILRYQARALLLGRVCWQRLLVHNFKNNAYKTFQKHPHKAEIPLFSLKVFSVKLTILHFTGKL